MHQWTEWKSEKVAAARIYNRPSLVQELLSELIKNFRYGYKYECGYKFRYNSDDILLWNVLHVVGPAEIGHPAVVVMPEIGPAKYFKSQNNCKLS